jgi:hypothetical protein
MESCRLCPFRGFSQRDRLLHHVVTYHTELKQYCCSGTKQLKALAATATCGRVPMGMGGSAFFSVKACR